MNILQATDQLMNQQIYSLGYRKADKPADLFLQVMEQLMNILQDTDQLMNQQIYSLGYQTAD